MPVVLEAVIEHSTTKELRVSIAISIGMAVAAALLSGCGLSHWAHNGYRLGPNHHVPPAAIADDWLDSGDENLLPLPPAHQEWWHSLEDPVVNNLVQTASEQNLTLRQAGTRILQARAARAIAAGNLFPQTQQAFGEYARIQESKTVALPAPLRAFDQWEVGFNASWELDLWGKLRRSIESADAQLDASADEYDAILVSLIAEVVAAYVEVRTFDIRLQYAQLNVEIQNKSRELSQARFDEGKSNKVGVYLADANLKLTEATIPPLEAGRRQAANRLCTLLGIPPTDLSEVLGDKGKLPNVPEEIAIGIPADLLRRRPDVRQAERLVAAQSAQIGVALAEYYPSIAINGEIYQASENLSDLFRSASNAGDIGPSFRWNVLNYGRITNNVRLQDARFRELVANYQNTVLVANQEVEDSLVAFVKVKEQLIAQRESVEALDESLQLLLIQYEEGKIDFSPIFVLQGSLRSAQDELAAVEGQVLLNLIAVYRALGGGWQIRIPNVPELMMAIEAPVEEVPAEVVPLPIEKPIEPLEPPALPVPAENTTQEANDGQ